MNSGKSPTTERPLKTPPLASAAAKEPVMTPSASEVASKRVSTFRPSEAHASSMPFVSPSTVNVAFPRAEALFTE